MKTIVDLAPQARLRDFARDCHGSVAITFAILAVVLMGTVGLAVDASRGYNVHSRIGQGLDAAALAGAKQLDAGASDADVANIVQAFFSQHMTNLNLAGVTLSGVDVTVDRAQSIVNAKARGVIETSFMKVLGFNSVNFSKVSEVAYKLRKVEMAMALDITGSMLQANKIDALKSATTDVIDAMFDEAATDDHVRISIVPWSSSVNAGALAGPVSNYQSVDQCVIERLGPNAGNDRAPYGQDALRASPGPAPNPYQFYGCPTATVVPLQNRTQRNTLKAQVMSYNPEGGTAGHIGAAWGYYMVSPEWASIVGAGSAPRPYSPNDTLKIVVLLTDGEFNMSYLTPGAYDAPTQTNDSYRMFQDICASMRTNKVLVYTVGFQLNDARAKAELEACSTNSGQHFNAASNSELKSVFRKISQQIMQLRIAR